MTSLVNSPGYLQNYINLSPTLPKDKRKKHFLPLILLAKSDITRKLQTSISYEYGHKSPQQNTGKPNSTPYKKNSVGVGDLV